MTNARKYRQYAQECLRWAARAEIEEDRVCFLEMADAWTKIALIKSDGARQIAFEGSPAEPLAH